MAHPLLAAWAAGAATFPALLAAHQLVCARVLRLPAHRTVVAGLLGASAVAGAGAVAGATFEAVYNRMDPPRAAARRPELEPSTRAALYAGTAVAVFWGLGGRFAALAPSHVGHVGAFGSRAASLPARDARYANGRVRTRITALGRRHGCHTCGRRFFSGEFIWYKKIYNDKNTERGGGGGGGKN
mgnify:CR=1 FL=1